MGKNKGSEVDLSFMPGDDTVSGVRTAEQADQGDLGWNDGDGSEADAEGYELTGIDVYPQGDDELDVPDPEDDAEFVTVGNTERVYSALEEFIVTIIEVWDEPSQDYMPTMQLRTLEGLLVCTLDSRDMKFTALVSLMADDIYEQTHAVEAATEDVESD